MMPPNLRPKLKSLCGSLQLCCAAGLLVGVAASCAPSETVPVADQESATPTAHFTLHEWGLVRHQAAGGEMATSGFATGAARANQGQTDPNDPGHALDGKPVIYLSALDAHDPEVPISVQVTMLNGSLHETWPAGVRDSPTSVRWSNVLVDPEHVCADSWAPAEDGPHCQALNSTACEAAELAAYVDASSCLSVDGEDAPVLLYNGPTQTHAAPIRVHNGSFSNTFETAIGPTWIVLESTVWSVGVLQPGEAVAMSNDQVVTLAEVSTGVLAALVARGLTSAEANDFVEAWEPDVLAAPYPWTQFGLYAPEYADIISPLVVAPPAAEQVRVLAFSHEVQPEVAADGPPGPQGHGSIRPRVRDGWLPVITIDLDALELGEFHNFAALFGRILSGPRNHLDNCQRRFDVEEDMDVQAVYALAINEDGRVTDVQREGGDDSLIVECVRSQLRSLRFPATSVAPGEIRVPIHIGAGGRADE